MRKQQKSILVLAIISVFITSGLLFFPKLIMAGDLEPPPGLLGPTMHTLDEIYNKLDLLLLVSGDGFAPVEKTGQTSSYGTGDDGDLQNGVAWPIPRFTDNGDGTVTDNLTGLIWLKDANCFGTRTWADALTDCNNLADGECELTDGSSLGDWRLPNENELLSLIDYGSYGPAMPSGHPFLNVLSSRYWSSTTFEPNSFYVTFVDMTYGRMAYDDKANNRSVWPVRGGIW